MSKVDAFVIGRLVGSSGKWNGSAGTNDSGIVVAFSSQTDGYGIVPVDNGAVGLGKDGPRSTFLPESFNLRDPAGWANFQPAQVPIENGCNRKQ
jgi:hypothetical protein